MSKITKIVDEFYSCGALDEPEGLTFHHRKHKVEYDEQGKEVARAHYSGSPNTGYKETVLTYDEIQALQKKHALMGAYGIVDKSGKKAHEQQVQERRNMKTKKGVEANRINFKLAQADAKNIGEDHEAVFTSKHPTVSEDVKAMLFTDARAAALVPAKKKAKISI